ncbi:MAG: sn-glycerol-3-phosphate import ATP-binding protein UgpC [Hyphomicrobiaceae bacterium]
MAGLSMRGVKKIYANGVEAISRIDLDVADGEFVVLVGPSGCGKSTLLRMIAGLETVTQGDIAIADRRVNDLEPADRDIAMVFQNYALYPHMSVYNNIAYGLRNRGTPKPEIETRVREVARLLEIEALLERKPRQLSGGQRQRVAMGRAIVRRPAVFLFDEPLSNLDAKLRVQMRVEIRRLQRDLGTTSIYVTHDQVEAMTMADRLVVMNAGKAEQIGTPRDVYQAPASTFVAGFIGSPAMNLLEGRVSSSGTELTFGGVTMRLAKGGVLPAGSDVIVGIRPEDVQVGAGRADLELTVDLVEHLGAETVVLGRTSATSRQAFALRSHGDVDFAAGSVLGLSLPCEKLHIFDAANGTRCNVTCVAAAETSATVPLSTG